jgi:bifunctional non-homologous end joining protein LigD
MERYPDGIDDGRLFQKNVARHFPDWVARARVRKVGGFVTHVIVDQPATLVYLANQACITLHTFLSTTDSIRNPDQLIFDLDPPGAEFPLARKVALDLRVVLEEELGLLSFVKTTGGDGLHVVVPLDAEEEFDAVRAFASDVGALIVQRDPERVTMEQRKNRRGKRLFLDVMRNAYAQTAVAPYSARARRKAPVAMPIDWDDLRDSKLRPDRYTIVTVPRRIAKEPDPWAAMPKKAQGLAEAKKRLVEALEEGDRR